MALNFPKTYLLILILIFFTPSTLDQGHLNSIIKIRSFRNVLKNWEMALEENDYPRLWSMVAPESQQKLTEVVHLLRKGNFEEYLLLARDFNTAPENLITIFSPFSFYWGLYRPEIELLRFFLQKKKAYFKELFQCRNFFYIPDMSFLDTTKKEKKHLQTSLKSLAFLSLKEKNAIEFLYFICPGQDPLGIKQIRKGDWRIYFDTW